MPVSDATQLLQKIEGLPRQLRTAFAAACAERMLAEYARYSEQAQIGKPDVLKSILTRLWQDIGCDEMSQTEIELAKETCDKLVPARPHPSVPGPIIVEDAPAAVLYALECHQSGMAQQAAWAAECARETLEESVMEKEEIQGYPAEVNDRLDRHPLLRAEVARQNRDLDDLSRRAVTLDELRQRSQKEAREFLPWV